MCKMADTRNEVAMNEGADTMNAITTTENERLDGLAKQAQMFVRFRSGYANADLGRLDAQKRFLRAFAGRISELSLYRKSEILLSVAHRIETDLSVAELLQLCRTTSALPLANADMETLPGEAVRGVSGAWYYSISKEAAIASIARTMHLDAGALAQRFDPEGVFDRREHPDFHNIYTAPAMTDADPRGILYGSGEERIGSMEELMTNMLPSLEQAEPEELAHAIFDILDAKKAQQLRVLRVHDETVIADYFVLCTGNSSTQVKSLGGEVEYKLGLRGVDPLHFEGRDNNSWVVLDYGSVIVHVFSREAREFYNLDKLYSDSKEIVYEGIDEKAAKETEKQ